MTISSAGGIEISRTRLTQNLFAMVALLLCQIAMVISWKKSNKILMLNLISLYLQFPIKILFISIARQFG